MFLSRARPLLSLRARPLATAVRPAKESVADLAKRVDLHGKAVLCRADLNVPLSKDEQPQITDLTRIRESLATIRLLTAAGARVILCSHLGRPKGKPSPKLSLAPVAASLGEQLGQPVALVGEPVGPAVSAAAAALAPGGVLLLENTRFSPAEEKNEPDFAAQLVADSGATVFVNDAFGCAHRAHASTAGVASAPGIEHAVSGLLLEKELRFLERAVLGDSPSRPLVAIVGGAKVSTKMPVLRSLLNKADSLLVGGAMAFTFVKARGGAVGNSLVEEEQQSLAADLVAEAEAKGKRLLLPVDAVASESVSADAKATVVPIDAVPDGAMGLDIGPATIAEWEAVLGDAGTVVWNGPMGVFESAPFAKGTLAIAESLAAQTARGAITIVGGGDSVAAINQAGLASSMSHVSTGGGASLELLEGLVLPGVAALDDVVS